jgi:hypothetical protein
MGKIAYVGFQDAFRQKCNSAGIESYFLDGPLTEVYWTTRPRIAVLNLEGYGYEDCGETIVDINVMKNWMLATGGKIKTKTSRYTSVFVYGLHNSLSKDAAVSLQELKESYHNFDALLDAMSRIAYLNVRKTSNSISPQDVASIYRESTGDWLNLLKEQFKILDPEIIIIGGIHGCAAANRIFGPKMNLKYLGHASLQNGAEVIPVKHFSRASYSGMASAIEVILTKKRGQLSPSAL